MSDEGANTTRDATLLRRLNESAVLELIREQGPIHRSELARRLRLSPPTITRIVADLIEQGLVSEHSHADSRGGRRPTLLNFNFRAGAIIGVYVQQHMMAALADLGGEILARRTAAALPGPAGVERLSQLILALKQEAVQLGVPVRGVGVGAPSIVNFRDGSVAWAPTLGWRDLPLRDRLEEKVGLPVFVENVVNLMALGERWRGVGRGRRHLVCISLAEGIGAGMILNGQLYRGGHDAAGEAGYIIPNERFFGRTYDDFGCLESMAGSSGIVARAQARLMAGEASTLAAGDSGNGSLTAEQVLRAAREGDDLACAVVRETVDYLSLAVANIAAIVDPELIIVTGDLTEFADLFVEPIRERVQMVIPTMPEIVLSELRVDAAVLGAVAIALSQTSGAVWVRAERA